MPRTRIEEQVPRTLAAANLTPRGRVFRSPDQWRDQILYQLLPDRFSDGLEATRPLFDRQCRAKFRARDRSAWMRAGLRFVGGTIKGIESKLDYLHSLGVTTLWINPPWRQRADLQTYHGYGIQNYLDVEPRFGTRQDLRDLVDAAHDRGMYVILDVIYNHSGNNWFYRDATTGQPNATMPYQFQPSYPVHGWRSAEGGSIPRPVTLDDGVWPEEFQNAEWYRRAGSIGRWGLLGWEDPMNPNVEFRRGDFYDLKKWALDQNDVVLALARVYQYWIAVTDCDGFRVDAVKHVSVDDSRRFCSAVLQYADSIGKENFLLTGEITDSIIAPGYVDPFGSNLTAVLGIIYFPNRLAGMVTAQADPAEFFALYTQPPYGMVRQFGNFIVSVLDDHDMSSRPRKERFAARGTPAAIYQQTANAVGVLLTTPGIPAIYYGTEQAFDGGEHYHDYGVEPRRFGEDRYVREAMFGGSFGAFGTSGCHFFDPDHPTYVRIAAIARLRNGKDLIGKTLRRGRLYPRETSYVGYPFRIPPRGELVAWSQVLHRTTVLVALNTNAAEARGAEVTVDADLHPHGSTMTFLYRSDWSETEIRRPPGGQVVTVSHHPHGRATVRLDLPPAGMAMLTKTE